MHSALEGYRVLTCKIKCFLTSPTTSRRIQRKSNVDHEDGSQQPLTAESQTITTCYYHTQRTGTKWRVQQRIKVPLWLHRRAVPVYSLTDTSSVSLSSMYALTINCKKSVGFCQQMFTTHISHTPILNTCTVPTTTWSIHSRWRHATFSQFTCTFT